MAPNRPLPPQAPGTPSKHGETFNIAFDAIVATINKKWPLGLQSKKDYSPSKSEPTERARCLFYMKWCFHNGVLDDVLTNFTHHAEVLYLRWVIKPRADRGVLPQNSNDIPKPITEKESEELLTCLINLLEEKYKARATTPRPRRMEDRFLTGAIEFSLSPLVGPYSKRPREESFADVVSTKKAKAADDGSRHMPPPRREQSLSGEQPQSQKQPAPRQLPPYLHAKSSLSANNSFADTSFASNTSSVFSRPPSPHELPTMPNTQDTEFDEDLPLQKTQENNPAFTTMQDDKYKSSNYGNSTDYGNSSSFDRNMANTSFDGDVGDNNGLGSQVGEELSQILKGVGIEEQDTVVQQEVILEPREREFLVQLEAVFPGVPNCMRSASIYVMYEIARVFLHAEVSIQDLHAPVTDSLRDYDALWKFLKSLPILQVRPFPEKCGAEVWKYAMDDKTRAGISVVLAGNLHFGNDLEPTVRLRLEPLKLDRSHRLGRRLGHDRFLEICMPSLRDRKIPKSIRKLETRGEDIFYEWLVDSSHCVLGRKWQPFCVKPSDRKKGKSKKDATENTDAEPSFRVYFFATEGPGFLADNGQRNTRTTAKRRAISIPELLNIVRPTEENTHQSYLKLFSRTTLALSRNNATRVLSQDQIRFQKEDIKYCGEVMNDGAARISLKLANEVRLELGLSYIPSAFQGRFGEAKGLWVVDGRDDIQKVWLEVYPQQQKWDRNSTVAGDGVSDDLSHRTFEVLKYSGPLKSADLNTQFLPLLVAQAVDRNAMKSTLSKILEDGLTAEVNKLREAFERPQMFRKWVRDSRPSTVERLKFGAVPFRGGMPSIAEERINVLLDAGFSPSNLNFLYDQARTIFKNHCEELTKKLNITVGKSTYAFMVPDFWGVLEPGEVYIDVSRFEDDVTGDYGAYLNGVDLLVARSPAHFVSDIQKVKSVAKEQLLGLKDVIVFSTKGNPSLASMLSGGDYDGDIAWICWDENIVDNFTSAKVPRPINLVEKKLLDQDKTKYKDLVDGSLNPTSLFLKKALKFNMQQSMLGVATSFKERVCYTQKSVDTRETRYLSQLLSDLVDAPKQGFLFDEAAFAKFKRFLNVTPIEPKYISGELDNGDRSHILDHLMVVARKTIEKSIYQLWKEFGQPPTYDKDLTLVYKRAQAHAETSKSWSAILEHLKEHLTALKHDWKILFEGPKKKKDEKMENFGTFVTEYYDKFCAISPPDVDDPIAQALLLSSNTRNSEELSQWSLLKASAFVSLYLKPYRSDEKQYVSNAVWWIAGRQLLRLKADASENGLPHSVAPWMFAILKPDNSMIERMMRDGNAAMMDENGSVRNAEELEDLSE